MATYASARNVPRMEVSEDRKQNPTSYPGRMAFYSGPLGPCLIIRHSKVSRTFCLGHLFMNHQKTLFSLGLGGCKDGPLKFKSHLADSKKIICFFMSARLHLPSEGAKML